MIEAVKTCLKKYFVIDGRACRSEYWLYSLFVFLAVIVDFIVAFVVSLIIGFISTALSGFVFVILLLLPLYFIIPGVTVTIRRLHDRDMSGLWAFLGLVPFGNLVLLVLMCLPGTQGENKYGPDPLVK